MRGKELTLPEVQARLPKNVLFAGPFFGFKEVTLFKCLACDHRWKQTPQGVSHTASGCPKCAAKLRNASRSRTTESYRRELRSVHPAIILLEEYVKDGFPILHKCACDHSWRVRPGCLLKAKWGCPNCAKVKSAQSLRSVKRVTRRGREFQLQGCEPVVLDWLLSKGVGVDEIGTSLDDQVPAIPYPYRGSMRTHFPDFLVRGVVLEVKSLYTLGLNGNTKQDWLEQTRAKVKGAACLHIPYRVVVKTANRIVPLPPGWETWSTTKLQRALT